MSDDPVIAALIDRRITLLNLAARFVGADVAQDVLQEACARFAECRTANPACSVRSRGEVRNIDAYVYAVVRNLAIDRARSLSVELQAKAPPEALFTVQSSDLTPEDAVIMRQDYEILRKSLESLDPRKRRAFELKRFEKRTLRDIGDILGVTYQRAAQLIKDAEMTLAMSLPDLIDRL